MASRYSEQQKKEALDAIAENETLSSVAKRLAIPVSTLSGWLKKSKQMEVGPIKPVSILTSSHQLGDIGDHLVDYICELLSTLKLQAKFLSNEEWLKAQSANQLAALHGVLADRTILLLEALSEPPQPTNASNSSNSS